MALRITLVTLLGALELILFVALLMGYDQQVGQYGFTVGADDVTIAAVEPQQPAALQGIKPGDRIVYQSLPLIGREILTLKEPVPANAPLTFQFIRNDKTQTVTLHAATIPGLFIQIQTITYALAGFIFGMIGLGLVLVRPSRMTWGFALIAPPMLLPWSLLFWSQQTESMMAAGYDIGVSILYALQIAGILIFASRFPNDKPHGLTRIIDRLSIPVGIIIAVVDSCVTLIVRFTSIPLPKWEMISNYEILLPGCAALIALIATFITTPGSARSRLVPVIGSFILLIALTALQQLSPELTSNNDLLFAANLANAAAPALVAIAVAYGVIRHHVMDVGFIIQRTMVYSLLTAIIIVTFSVIEYFVGKILEAGRLAEIFEMAAAVGVGLSISYIHGKLERFLEFLFFRRRYAAQRRLRKTARALPHASTLAFIDGMLVEEPVDALYLTSAAVFRQVGNHYKRVAAHGWDEQTVGELDFDDLLVVRMRAELQPIAIEDIHWHRNDIPHGQVIPVYAIPVSIGHNLEGILIYGRHNTGEDLDPNELKSLYSLANSAALAYGHLTQQQLSMSIEVLRSENLTLQKTERKLEKLLQSRLGNQPE